VTRKPVQEPLREQIEEEAAVKKVVAVLTSMGESEQGLTMVDRDLAGRSAT